VSPAEKEKEKAAEAVDPQGKDERTRTTICLCFRTAVCESSREGGEEEGCGVGSSDFEIFLEIQYASCVFGLALKS
jgi:hypothetical protein